MAPPILKAWNTDPEFIDFLNFIIERTENVESPMSIKRIAREFKEKNGVAQTIESLAKRIIRVRTRIHSFEHIDTNTKVKLLFALSASVDAAFLKELTKSAEVGVDKKNRITYYKANDESLELRGDHSLSARNRTVMYESKRSLRSLIHSYFEKKNNVDAAPEIEEEKEIRNFIEFVTEKCDKINFPLSIRQLVRDFNKKIGISRSGDCIRKRVKTYCRVIQQLDFLDNQYTVKQLFGLSATLDSNFLNELRKGAVVEVDNLNRITKYKANNGRLILHGDHSQSGKKKLEWIERRKKKNAVKKNCSSNDYESEESENDNQYSDDDDDEYSSEEFGSEFDSDDEKTVLDETDSVVKAPRGTKINETPVRNRLPSEMEVEDNSELDPSTGRSPRSEETRMRKDEENDSGTTGNASVVTRSGRLSKKRQLNFNVSYHQENSSSPGTPTSTNSASSRPAKQKKIATEKEQVSSSSNQSRSSSKSIRRSTRSSPFPSLPTESEENMENQNAPGVEGNPSDYHGPRVQEVDDYDYNPREDNIPDRTPIDNRLEELEQPAAEEHNSNIEAQTTNNRTDTVALEPKPEKESIQINKSSTQPTNGNEAIVTEAPIKVEQEEPSKVENSTEDVKPKISHNFKIKFFEAMKSLILFLDTPSLSDLQSQINQKIRKMKKSNELLQNNELIPALEFMIAKTTNQSSNNLPKSVESVRIPHFLCHLKAAILNSKLYGLDSLMEKVKNLNEDPSLLVKSIPVETLASVLQTTMDIIGF